MDVCPGGTFNTRTVLGNYTGAGASAIRIPQNAADTRGAASDEPDLSRTRPPGSVSNGDPAPAASRQRRRGRVWPQRGVRRGGVQDDGAFCIAAPCPDGLASGVEGACPDSLLSQQRYSDPSATGRVLRLFCFLVPGSICIMSIASAKGDRTITIEV